MGKFNSARDEVLYQLTLDGTAETIGDVNAWGQIHLGLGEVTRAELSAEYSGLLAGAGASLGDFPDGQYWIVTEDSNGFVSTASFSSESGYRAELEAAAARWAAFEDGAA